MKIIHKKDQITTNWSGGETTELFIYPEETEYQKRNFKFRISTATVEIDESTFTPLAGVDRTLMVLDGKMKLIHQDHHFIELSPLNSDQFIGDWITRSEGKCTDLNLMCREGTKGEIIGYQLEKNSIEKLQLSGISNFLYLYRGTLEIRGFTISEGDFIILNQDSESLSIKSIDNCTIALIRITSLEK